MDVVAKVVNTQELVAGIITCLTGATNGIWFGDGDTGFTEDGANTLKLKIGGTFRYVASGYDFMSSIATGGGLQEATTTLVPSVIPISTDTDTGLGHAGTDAPSIIAGGIEAQKWSEFGSHVVIMQEAHVGLTADVGSVQGGTPLLSTNNIISTCANAGDAVTLPSAFAVGTIIRIKNNGAQSCDVFPASGDNLGAGADTAAALAAGASITYIATAASSTWTSIGN